MAKKRRKSPASSGKASAKRKSKTSKAPEVSVNVSSTILRQVLDIASSKIRSANVLQTFYDGNCWIETKKIPTNATITVATSPVASSSPAKPVGSKKQQIRTNFDAYWVILATNTMNRLLRLQYQEMKGKPGIVKYFTALADALATILLSDKSKLEKCAQVSSARSILCRTVLTTSLAALYAIRNYDPRQKSEGKHDTYVAAVATLERLVHLRASCDDYGNIIDASHNKQNANSDTDILSTVGKWTESKVGLESSLVEELLESAPGNSEHECVKILLETTEMMASSEPHVTGEDEADSLETDKPSASKRSTRARSGGKASRPSATKRKSPTKKTENDSIAETINPLPIVTAIEKLLASEDFSLRVDGRITAKRWASIAIVWSREGDGQTSILREIHEFSSGKEYDSAFTTFQKSRLIGALISILIESGTQCGARPPTGSVENYLLRIAATTDSKSSEESRPKRSKKSFGGEVNSASSKRSKSLRRLDIRDWTTVVIYDYLQNHKKCLLEGVMSTRENESRNNSQARDETSGSGSHRILKFSDIMNGMCRIASASVRDSTYSQQNSWKKTLLSIAAAFCFEMSVESDVPLDSKMMTFALSQFVDSMRMMDPNSSIAVTSSSRVAVASASSFVSEKQMKDFESKHMLRVELPKPLVPGTSFASNGAEFVSSKTCKFAGIVNGDPFSDENAIALVIRAVQKSSREDGSSPAIGKLLSFLIDVVKRAYDTRTPRMSDDSQQQDDVVLITSSGKRKRKSTKGSSTNRRGGRRRKIESGEAKNISNGDTMVWNRISAEKASVAITALNAIRMWLMNTKRLGSCAIRRLLRNTVTTEHMLDLVKLGETLDKIMIKSRCVRTHVAYNASSLPSDSPLSNFSSGDDFTSSEILLWNAHMSMCQVFGRGQLTYAENCGLDPIIWSAENRMAVYEAIAACIDQSHFEATDKEMVSLPAAHHALLAANMSSAVKETNCDPEKHLVSSYIDTIIHVFQNLDDLSPKDWGPNGRIIDDNIPLSYNDVRALILAQDSVSSEENCHNFGLLVHSALEALKPLMKNKAKRERLLRNPEISGFVARFLVLCYSMVIRVLSGKEFEQIFYCNMGCSQMSMPSFVTEANWYRQDRAFMGIFDTWKSPSFSWSVADKADSSDLLHKFAIGDFQSLLEMCFSMGFDAAPHDHCHLLFTAWNGLDQIPDNKGSSNGRDQFPSLVSSTEDYEEKILQLREDVYTLHQASTEGAPIDLKGMIARASEVTDLVLINHVPDDEKMKQAIPLPVMVLLAALPTYIAAAISACTKPGNDYFSTTMSRSWARNSKRNRGYSSESDHPPSDCESDEDADDYETDARIEAISRLRDCCDAFGAAPIHPDWLDVSCSLCEGIRPSDAVEMSTTAIKTLSRLITVAFTRYKRHQSWALQTLFDDQDGAEQHADLCSTLLRWSRHEIGPSEYPASREWLDDVTSLTSIPQQAIKNVLDDESARDLERTKEFWCPYAGQKLRGLLQEENGLMGGWETTDAELRAGGEWELLLAKALCVSCLKTNQDQNRDQNLTSDEDPLIDPDFKSEMANAQFWRTVFMSATSHLVPVAGLLRLGLGKVGRKPHPFAFHENDKDPYAAVPLHFSERLSGGEGQVASSSSLRGTILETLSLLARLSIEAEESLSITCHAAASHLVVDTETFLDLEAMSSMKCAIMGLKLIRRIAESSPKKDAKVAIPFVVERLVSLIEYCGGGGIGMSAGRTYANFTKFQRLHHFLGDPPSCQVEIIASKSSIDILKILKSRKMKELCEGQTETFKWFHTASKESAVGELVSILCEDSLRANCRTRSHIALMLSRVGIIESHSIIKSTATKSPLVIHALIRSFNKIDKKRLKAVVVKDFCGIRGSKSSSETFRRDIASIFCLLLFSRSSPKFDKAKFVHDTLMAVFDSWKKIDSTNREVTLEVLMMYGAFFNSIFDIGSKLVELTGTVESRDAPDREAGLLSIFVASIKNLQQVLTRKHEIPSDTSEKSARSLTLDAEGKLHHSKFPKSCSFIQKSGFHGQHWYHCHTCGLVADKGCCTLCALVCHKGHDVTYSRHSSFFCDCAAENGHSTEQNRVSCKCLKSLSSAELDSMFESEHLWRKSSVDVLNQDCEIENIDFTFEKSISVEIAKYCFGDAALKSVNDFLIDVKTSPFLDSLFRVLDKEFTSWKTTYGDSVHFLLKRCSEASIDETPIFRLPHKAFQGILRKRRSKVLKLNRLEERGFVSIQVATGFSAKLPADSSTHDLLAISRLSRNGISRSVLVFDSRGRMVIAEPCSLVFCSPLAAINGRSLSKSEDEYFTRQQMCILGTASLPFNVVGLRLCTQNERHIIAWGTSEACVLVLKADYSGVEETINLTFEVDDEEKDNEALVNCEWLPGSQTHIAIGLSRQIRLFDICRFESTRATKRSHPIIGYNLGFEASLRDLSIVPQKNHGSGEDDIKTSFKTFQAEFSSKMFLLLENGRLHSLDIQVSNGKIDSPSELHFEPSSCISISTEGIRPRATSSIGLPGASTRTLGEGSKLVYLKQSRCLLYKCKSAAVVALMLGTDGDVTGTFELLPHTIRSGVVASEDEDEAYSISGPYTLWTELGMVYRNGDTYFRVACAGRSNRNNQPKLLCIDFNEKETKIKDITCSLEPGLNPGSFEGVAAFTSPVIHDDSHDRYMTGERTFLSVLTSGGNLHIFGEDLVDMMPVSAGSNSGVAPSTPVELVSMSKILSSPIKKFPLTIFEQLTNVSENENLLFSVQGFGIDSKEIKTKLARDGSSSFACPKREGCCMTISLPQSETTTCSKPNTKSSSLVISAIRVLVGSSPNVTPSKILVQGRSIEITPKLKRWYNVPLTDEEVARGMRSGLISLWIGPSFDTANAPVIDSVEVFARERKSIETSLPRNYYTPMTASTLKDTSWMEKGLNGTKVVYDGLLLSVVATMNMCELIGPSARVSDAGKDLLKELIQTTSIHPEKKLRKSLEILSDSLASNTRTKWSFRDENMLVGCLRSLDQCNTLLNESTNTSNGFTIPQDLKWDAIRMVLKDCLKISNLIARERPSNYLQSMGNMQENDLKSGSIAIEASNLILMGLKHSNGYEELVGGDAGIVTLSLTEMAIVVYMDDSTSTKDFIQTNKIREFLDVANVSTCEAISSFFQDNQSEQNRNRIPDLFVQMEAARRVAYQCDSCSICPMKEVRYTILEEDYGMDLCKKCYEVGKAFASKKSRNSTAEVVINGKSMGENLTCAHMKKMVPVSLEKMEMDVEELDVTYSPTQAVMRSEDDSEDHEDESKPRVVENVNGTNQQELSDDHRGYEYFLGELFAFVMEQLSFVLKKERCSNSTESLIKLLLDLIMHSKRHVLRHERAACFVKDLSKGMSQILNSSSPQQKLTHHKMSTLVTYLRGLSSLAAPHSKSDFHFPGSKADSINRSQVLSNGRSKPKFICDVHGIPAVRRRCDKVGPNKDRRFYVCGKEKGERCDYFEWADDGHTKETKSSKSQFRKVVQAAMLDNQLSSEESIYDRLCMLLEWELFGEEEGAYEVTILASNTTEKKNGESPLKSLYSIQNMETDFNDGIFCSKEKLLDVVSGEVSANAEFKGSRELGLPARVPGALLLEASLDLLTLIADHKTNGISRWFSILCEIAMAANKHSSLRPLATKVLKALCDGNRKKYHYVRDHFTFCFQLKRLYHFSYTVLQAALISREKTRQCSIDWKGSEFEWSTLGICDLIGTEVLISEDDITELNQKGCGKALDEMWAIIKNRGESWRQFCGFRSLPLSHRHSAKPNANERHLILEKDLSDVAPIKVLFWIASSLVGINKVKVLRMIDFALIDWKGRKISSNVVTNNIGDGCTHEKDSDDAIVIGIGSGVSKPEEILFNPGNREMEVGDIVTFSLHLIHNGNTSELRKVAYQIVAKLSQTISSEERVYLFQNLVASIENVGRMGKASFEFLTLLQCLSKFLEPNEAVGRIADFVMDCFIQQLDAVKCNKSNCEWMVLKSTIGNSVTKKKFDLSGCHFCIKPQHYFRAKESTNKSPERRAASNSSRAVGPSGSTGGAGRTSAPSPRQKWRYEQLSSYSRCRLEGLKESCISNEFSLFYKLKYRLSISDIHLTVSDPRGRYVKTVSVFFTPRPLSGSLKSDTYASKWQKIATLNLARGGSRASVSLPQPIIAANIRVEFTEFYERPGDKEKGGMVLHCPRCLRPVTNAHGVCATCGEVAFQCRKCRHINYDRLDAFLCVECGYTCCGSFSFELKSAVVTNAIAINNDATFDESTKMYNTASSIQEGLKEKLREKLRSLNQNKDENEFETESFFDSEIERSFLGLLPTNENGSRKDFQKSRLVDRFEKQGSVVKYVAHPDNISGGTSSGRSDSSSDRSERARSLIRLARQIRSESSSSSDRRRSTDIIIRHLGRVSLQNLEDENELLEIFESGTSGTDQEEDGDKNSEDNSKEKSQKMEMEECQKIFALLREAWRESYELRRRIDAWKALNSGALIKATQSDRITEGSFSFTPSHCSVCGGPIAFHLLVLWLKLFLVAPAQVRVKEEFFVTMFQDIGQSHSKGLQEIKKRIIIAIATVSRQGAERVLRELEKRLKASRDMYCAEILGKIMEIEGFAMIDEYAKLAMEILSSQADTSGVTM